MISKLYFTSNQDQQYAKELSSKLSIELIQAPKELDDPCLELAEGELSFFHPNARATKQFKVDFQAGSMGWRLKRADHEKLIKKALGRSEKPLHILDCTAGMLQDSLLFLSLGHKVSAVEQSSILFFLLQDGIKRSTDKALFSDLTLLHGDACKVAQTIEEFDVVYFDPMYPATKKTALGSGQLDYLARILEAESIKSDPQKDFEALRLLSAKKMIIKRPIKAEPFATGINYQVPGKTTRFDVYI